MAMVLIQHVHEDLAMTFSSAKLPMCICGNDITLDRVKLHGIVQTFHYWPRWPCRTSCFSVVQPSVAMHLRRLRPDPRWFFGDKEQLLGSWWLYL